MFATDKPGSLRSSAFIDSIGYELLNAKDLAPFSPQGRRVGDEGVAQDKRDLQEIHSNIAMDRLTVSLGEVSRYNHASFVGR